MISTHENSVKESKGLKYKSEEEARRPQNSPTASVTTLIHQVDLRSIAQRKKVNMK